MKKALTKALAILLATLTLMGIGAIGAAANEAAITAEGEIVTIAEIQASSLFRTENGRWKIPWFLWLSPVTLPIVIPVWLAIQLWRYFR